MGRKFTQFIPQNIAPIGAKYIGIYNENNELLLEIPLDRLSPIKKKKLYSFGIVSDTHMGYNSYTNKNDPSTVGTSLEDGNGYGYPGNGTNLRYTLDFMNKQGISFLCNCGDLTNIGFYSKSTSTLEYYPYQFQEYRDILALYPHIPVYNVIGNHENYYSNITNSLDKLEEYTGRRDIAYYFEQGDDVFIVVGQSSSTIPMTNDHLQWLTERLQEFKDRRCFVFIHSFMRNDSGAPCNARDNDIFSMSWGTTKTDNFKTMLAGYPNVILFHGHSHMKFESQKYDKNANYTERNGFKSVHVPSLGDPRVLTDISGNWETDNYGGQFYIVDVYNNYIILNSYYVHRESKTAQDMTVVPIMIGTYKIGTIDTFIT